MAGGALGRIRARGDPVDRQPGAIVYAEIDRRLPLVAVDARVAAMARLARDRRQPRFDAVRREPTRTMRRRGRNRLVARVAPLGRALERHTAARRVVAEVTGRLRRTEQDP